MISIQERVNRARRIARKFCTKCKKEMPCNSNGIHGCEGCWVYWLMNSTMEGKDIDVEKRGDTVIVTFYGEPS